jgi:hypothetical protein
MSTVDYIPGVSLHAHERMVERFGADLTYAQWIEVVSKIVNREALLVATTPLGKEFWLVEIGGLRIRVGWSPQTATIMTVMDPSKMSITTGIQRAKESRLRLRDINRKKAAIW